jgi:hypothetical protein
VATFPNRSDGQIATEDSSTKTIAPVRTTGSQGRSTARA